MRAQLSIAFLIVPEYQAHMAIEKHIQHAVAPAITELQAYKVADHGPMVKLDAMENPYPLPDTLQKPYAEALAGVGINRYPDPEAKHLRPLLRQVMGIDDDLDMMFGNGSDELIQIISVAARATGRPILAPEPSFVMYRLVCQQLEIPYIGVPLNKDFTLDADAMMEAIHQHRPAVVFLAYPNNPSGNLYSREEIAAILEQAPGLVVVDEAYQIFSQQSYLDQIKDYPNLVVMRTLSKAGLAGLRFGYLVGQAAWIEQFNKLRLPYNINTLTQTGMAFLLQHYSEFERQASQLLDERESMSRELERLDDIRVYPSDANFLLLRCLSHPAEEVFQALLDKSILIKKLHGVHALLDQTLRVSIGLPSENQAFLAALKSILKQ